MTRPKSIFEYENYRNFLRDIYEHYKAKDKKYSYRYFARLAGFQSSNFMMLVIDGKRNLALPSIERFAKALKLNKEEAEYFRNLVLFNQSSTIEERGDYAAELLKTQSRKKIQPLKLSQFNYLQNWYYVAIREMASLADFREDPQWIGKHVFPNITPAQAKTALNELMDLGLLVRNQVGKLVPANPNLATEDEVVSCSIAHYHRQALERAAESIERFPRERRDLSVVAVPVSAENFKILKERISAFRAELVQLIGEAKSANTIYQLNIQLFPIAGTDDEDAA